MSELIAAAGAFLTNFPARGWLGYETLRARREDLIMVHLKGNRDGTSEVDYTVNPATGFPWATGPRNLTEPLNSVLPAWDIAMGELAAIGLLAADRHRTRTGEGQLVETALSDVAFAVTGHLGRVAQAQLDATDSPRRDGNYLYGAFGHDFVTRDERHVMVVALTDRQWSALLEVTGTREQMEKINEATGVDLDTESGRFEDRDLIAAILRPWFESRELAEIRAAFEGTGVSWGIYQTFRQLVEDDPRVATEMWEDVEHPGVGTYRMPGTPLDFSAIPRQPVRRAPLLGEHTEEILAGTLGLADAEIGRLVDAGTVAPADCPTGSSGGAGPAAALRVAGASRSPAPSRRSRTRPPTGRSPAPACRGRRRGHRQQPVVDGRQDDRTEHGTPDRAQPAEHDHREDEDRKRERELIGIDGAQVRREERAGHSAQCGTYSIGQQLRAHDRNAHARRRTLSSRSAIQALPSRESRRRKLTRSVCHEREANQYQAQVERPKRSKNGRSILSMAEMSSCSPIRRLSRSLIRPA